MPETPSVYAQILRRLMKMQIDNGQQPNHVEVMKELDKLPPTLFAVLISDAIEERLKVFTESELVMRD